MRRRDFLQAARGALGTAAIASPALAQLGAAMPPFDQTPDKPRSFGYKNLRLASSRSKMNPFRTSGPRSSFWNDRLSFAMQGADDGRSFTLHTLTLRAG